MKFLPLFEVRVTHTFYLNGRCTGVTVRPTADTQRLLANHRCMWKAYPDGGVVLTPVAGDDNPFLRIAAGAVFTFDLLVDDSDFPLFTDLSDVLASPAPVFSTRGTASHTLLLRTADPTPTERRPAGALAEVEIVNRAPQLEPARPVPAEPPVMRIAFSAKRARWAYYVVTDIASPTATLSIANGDSAATVDDPAFGSVAPTLLGGEDVNDPLVARLSRQYNELNRVRFLSDDAVLCRQKSRDRLVLRNNGDALIEPLPNPSPRSFSTIGEGDEPSLFYVVRYVTPV